MFRPSVVVARQREVRRFSVDTSFTNARPVAAIPNTTMTKTQQPVLSIGTALQLDREDTNRCQPLAGNGDVLGVAVYQNIRLSRISVSEVLDSDHLPLVFHILDLFSPLSLFSKFTICT
jgi:hypothetical protein